MPEDVLKILTPLMILAAIFAAHPVRSATLPDLTELKARVVANWNDMMIQTAQCDDQSPMLCLPLAMP